MPPFLRHHAGPGGQIARALIALLLAVSLVGCAPAVEPEIQRRALVTDPLPQMKTFGAPRVYRPALSNADIARDFMELSFQMESGRALPALTRFEGPVTVALKGQYPASVGPDLDRLLNRLRTEAKIDIARVSGGQANITVEFLSRRALQSIVPQAACFVVPRVANWGDFRRSRRSGQVEWASLTVRDRVAVFIPNDTNPQEMRDCLHEEIAQALGPLNDLYRLPDSVFNDDNFNTILTGFDMLILRLTYAPALQNGMTRDQVAARLPQLLSAINPHGDGLPSRDAGPTPRAWVAAIETALGPGATRNARRDAARRAVAIAQSQGWRDGRLAFSLFALGRLSLAEEGEVAVRAFVEAGTIYRSLPGTAVHIAHVDMQLAAFALSANRPDEALKLANQSLLAVAEAENAALLATLLMIKSEALVQLGRPSEARAVRLDSLGWARYGFGPEAEVRARMSEIAALTPKERVALQ